MRNKLKQSREKAGHTQESFARECGINFRTYQKYEQGARTPKLPIMKTIMDKLKENSISLFDQE